MSYLVGKQGNSAFKESFKATAGQTQVTFLVDLNPNATSVYKNGVMLYPSDYTLLGKTITFGVALNVDDEIVVESTLAKSVYVPYFDGYYGPLASDPATRPDGTARRKGDEYFSTTANKRKVWNGSAWEIATADAVTGPALTPAPSLDDVPSSMGAGGLSDVMNQQLQKILNRTEHLRHSVVPAISSAARQGKHSPIAVVNAQSGSFSYSIQEGAPVVSFENAPNGVPAMKIVASAFSRIRLDDLAGLYFDEQAYLSIFGNASNGVNEVNFRAYPDADSFWTYFNATNSATENSTSDQGGQITKNFNPSHAVSSGAVPYVISDLSPTDLVTNGGFDSTANWSLSGGATIGGGKLTINSVDGSMSSALQVNRLTVGKYYLIEADIEILSGTGGVAISDNNNGSISRSSTGKLSGMILATATGVQIKRATPGVPVTATVDNVVIKEVISYYYPHSFPLYAADVIVNPVSGQTATVWLFAAGLGNKRKSRICISLDDGFASAFNYLPVFQKRGLKCTYGLMERTIGTPGYATMQHLRTAFNAGCDLVAHGPSVSGGPGSIPGNYPGNPQAAVADMLATVEWLRSNGLLRYGAEKCYIWPQGAYQYSLHDLSILNEALSRGFTTGRASWMQPIRAQRNWDSLSKYQRMTMTCIGHQFKSPSGTMLEADNIAEIVQRIKDCGKYGVDTFLQLHEIRPTSTPDASMGAYGIRLADLEVVLDTIKSEIEAGRMSSVGMSELVYDTNYWSEI